MAPDGTRDLGLDLECCYILPFADEGTLAWLERGWHGWQWLGENMSPGSPSLPATPLHPRLFFPLSIIWPQLCWCDSILPSRFKKQKHWHATIVVSSLMGVELRFRVGIGAGKHSRRRDRCMEYLVQYEDDDDDELTRTRTTHQVTY